MIRLKTESLLDLTQTIAADLFTNIDYPWEAVSNIGEHILKLFYSISKDEFKEIEEGVFVSKLARISKHCFLKAPCIIDSNAEIREGAFIRGSVIVGKNCVVGNSSELKNCVLFNNVQVPHFNYVGDSILGFKSHMGAGAIISNVKSDKSDISIRFFGGKINTNLRKFGAIVGDCVEIGCNSVLNPGTIVGRESNIYPLSMVRGYIGERKIFKNTGVIVDKK